jgi:hypothetical protein
VGTRLRVIATGPQSTRNPLTTTFQSRESGLAMHSQFSMCEHSSTSNQSRSRLNCRFWPEFWRLRLRVFVEESVVVGVDHLPGAGGIDQLVGA